MSRPDEWLAPRDATVPPDEADRTWPWALGRIAHSIARAWSPRVGAFVWPVAPTLHWWAVLPKVVGEA